MRTTSATSVVIVIAALASGVPLGLDAASAGTPCARVSARVDEAADRDTTREIERRIAGDATVAPLADQVHVTTADGVVTLTGAIASDEDRMVLASLAESAPGVRHVEDRLEVRGWHAPPSASRAR